MNQDRREEKKEKKTKNAVTKFSDFGIYNEENRKTKRKITFCKSLELLFVLPAVGIFSLSATSKMKIRRLFIIVVMSRCFLRWRHPALLDANKIQTKRGTNRNPLAKWVGQQQQHPPKEFALGRFF